MVEEIKTMETWEEANRWLAKHGYGLTQIEQQKAIWQSKKESAKPVIKTAALKS